MVRLYTPRLVRNDGIANDTARTQCRNPSGSIQEHGIGGCGAVGDVNSKTTIERRDVASGHSATDIKYDAFAEVLHNGGVTDRGRNYSERTVVGGRTLDDRAGHTH